MPILIVSTKPDGRRPLPADIRRDAHLATIKMRTVIHILEGHGMYGPEWAKVANNVLEDIENYLEDEKEHRDA